MRRIRIQPELEKLVTTKIDASLNSNEKSYIIRRRKEELSKKSTPSELKFQKILKSLNIKYQFQKGFYAGNFSCVVDFYIKNMNICIEIDGGYHTTPEQIKKDKYKDNYLRSRGFNIVRFTNKEVSTLTPEEIIDRISNESTNSETTKLTSLLTPQLKNQLSKMGIKSKKDRLNWIKDNILTLCGE
jgi:very-short-patch-repair endonuclease